MPIFCLILHVLQNKWTALSDRSHADVVELLLENDAGVNIQGNVRLQI